MYQVDTGRVYTRKEMCRMYKVSYKTFAKWIEPFEGEINTTGNRIFTIKQVEFIFAKLGAPGNYLPQSKQSERS